MDVEINSSLEQGEVENTQHPLTLKEKKRLVKAVQKLISVPAYLTEVIRILSENGIDTTTEVDFENMETHVQRTLQAFVTENKIPRAGALSLLGDSGDLDDEDYEVATQRDKIHLSRKMREALIDWLMAYRMRFGSTKYRVLPETTIIAMCTSVPLTLEVGK